MRRTSFCFNALWFRGVLLTLMLAWTPAAKAAEVIVSTTAARPAEAPALEIKDDAVQLSLDRAVEIALEQNLGIVVQRYTRTQSRLGLVQGAAVYDLTVFGTGSAQDRKSPTFSQIEASKQSSQNFNFNFIQLIPTGGELTLGWNGSRSESNSPVLRANVIYGAGTSFSLRQPLLRDFGRIATERNLLFARADSRISRQEFEREVVTTLQQVINAYWALVEARQQLVVSQESLALAQELYNQNRIKVEVGTLARLELVQSEAAIATREEDIIRATAGVGDAEDELRRLLNLPAGDLWQKPISPLTPMETERIQIDVNEAILTAYENRPELQRLALQVERNKITVAYLRNQELPTVDLNLSYNYSGIGTDFSSALEQVKGFDFRGWAAQVNFAYPLPNRFVRAQSAIARLEVERAEVELEQQRAMIATEVRRAARAVETAAKQIEAARISRQFQEKNLEAERKRYENGMSTSFQITQVQEDLSQARSREVSATIVYRTALAEYYRSIGQLMDQEGVVIDDPRDFAGARRFSFSREPLPGEGK